MVVYRAWAERVWTESLQEVQAQFLRLYIAVLRGTHRHWPRAMYSQVLSSDIVDTPVVATPAVDSWGATSVCTWSASSLVNSFHRLHLSPQAQSVNLISAVDIRQQWPKHCVCLLVRCSASINSLLSDTLMMISDWNRNCKITWVLICISVLRAFTEYYTNNSQ